MIPKIQIMCEYDRMCLFSDGAISALVLKHIQRKLSQEFIGCAITQQTETIIKQVANQMLQDLVCQGRVRYDRWARWEVCDLLDPSDIKLYYKYFLADKKPIII